MWITVHVFQLGGNFETLGENELATKFSFSVYDAAISSSCVLAYMIKLVFFCVRHCMDDDVLCSFYVSLYTGMC